MPRDADSGKATLKRGDACLYCRKRRIKCSAEKPSCSQCNGKRDCTYDNGKPVSRVRQLEDKVAQLESMLLQTSSRRPSESEGESSRMGSRTGSGNVPTTLSGNRSTPASDVNMQQEPIPENMRFDHVRRIMAGVVEGDWRGKAELILQERISSGEGDLFVL